MQTAIKSRSKKVEDYAVFATQRGKFHRVVMFAVSDSAENAAYECASRLCDGIQLVNDWEYDISMESKYKESDTSEVDVIWAEMDVYLKKTLHDKPNLPPEKYLFSFCSKIGSD
jgi:hypothetical protein